MDRVRRDFVANVSHELRTPLTAVRGYVEALMDEPIAPEQRRKFLEVIERHTGRMERLVRDLLRLARLDAQQETADVHAIDVATLLRTATADLSERIELQKLEVGIAVDAAAAVIEADPTKMHDALRNLIENAVNYSAEGGRIELRPASMETARCFQWATTAPESLRPISAACSSGSTVSTNHARAIPAARALACRSCAT